VARLRESDWLLLLGVLVSQFSVFLCALRLNCMIAAWGRTMPLLPVYRIHLKSLFYFVFVPFSIGADVAKLAMLTGVLERKKMQAAWIVVSDRLVGFISFLSLSFLGFIPTSKVLVRSAGIERGYLLVVVGIILFAVLLFLVPGRRRLGLDSKVKAFQETLHRSLPWTLKALALSILMQLGMCTAVYCAALSFSIQISWVHTVFVISSSMLFQLIPVSVVGLGATELAAVGLFMAVGAGRMDAVLLVSTAYSYKLLSALLGGLLEYWEIWRGKNGLSPELKGKAANF